MMRNNQTLRQQPLLRLTRIAKTMSIVGASALLLATSHHETFAQSIAPYENMPDVAPIGKRINPYLPVPDSAKGPPIDATKGYRTEKLGQGLFMVTDNAYQSMFMVYDMGVVVIDAPPSYASKIPAAIAEITKKPITHLIYSHSHTDHIGGASTLGGHPIIIAQQETKRLLAYDKDPNRPLPTITFKTSYTLTLGNQKLELSYHGYGHEPGNIYIYAPEQKTLMIVDVIYPGWMMWRRLALAQDIPGLFRQVEEIKTFDFDKLVAGHVGRLGNRADVELQSEFMQDLKAAAGNALAATKVGVDSSPADLSNPWAVYDSYIDRVAISCVNELTPKWQNKLAAFDVFIWDQCYAMEQSLRID
jgi:glyoxylase-like metal-dependent hydrolase (beta-lactamase superfamily II)